MNYIFWYDTTVDEKLRIDCRRTIQAFSIEEAVFKLVESIEGVNFMITTVNHIPYDQVTLNKDKYKQLINRKYNM